MIAYFILILAIPLGFALAHITRDEKQIYSKPPYFPILLWVLALITAIFYTINKQIALTMGFIFIMTLTWSKA